MTFAIETTAEFDDWMDGLRDKQAQARIAGRILRMASGLFGDVEPVGEGVSEARFHFGPGYRVYFVERGNTVIILLCGGDKKSQGRDIKKARELAADL